MRYAGEPASRNLSSDEAGCKINQENSNQEAGCSSASNSNVVGKFRLEKHQTNWFLAKTENNTWNRLLL